MQAPMRVIVQMDELRLIDPSADSTYALMAEAARRGYDLAYYLPQNLSYDAGEITAHVHEIDWQGEGTPTIASAASVFDLRQADVILMRQDPPFDMAYITATHILEMLKGDALVVNDPAAVRNAPEKLLVLQFADLMPPTLVSRNLQDISDFRKKHKDIIIKPLFGNGGAGIFRIAKDDSNFHSLLEMFFASSREPIMAQQFLSQVSGGDKRIILADGEPIGAINRVPPAGEIRSNMHIGGTPVKAELSKRDLEICQRIKPYLQENGLVFTGIDVIGGYLTEINVTSPTGLQEMGRFDGTNPAAMIWDAIEKRL